MIEIEIVNDTDAVQKTMNDLLCRLYYPVPQKEGLSFKLDVAELERSINMDLSERPAIPIEDKSYVVEVREEKGFYVGYVINADNNFLRVLEIYLRKYIKNIKLKQKKISKNGSKNRNGR